MHRQQPNFAGAVQGPADVLPDAAAELREERSRLEIAMRSLAGRAREQAALFQFTDRLQRARSLLEVFDAGLDAIIDALQCDRASVLLFDGAGVMRFVGSRGLSPQYRGAVEGHSPWKRGEQNPQPIAIPDIARADVPDSLRGVIRDEGIGALGFIPLVSDGELIGKFMVYYNAPHAFGAAETDLSLTIGRQLAFGVIRLQAEQALRESEARHRALFESMDEGYCVVQVIFDGQRAVDFQFIETNPAFERQSGFKDARGRRMREVSTADEEPLFELYGGIARTGQAVRFVHHAAAVGRWFDVCAFRVGPAERRQVGVVFSDVSERKKSEQELSRHRTHLETMVQERTARLEESYRRLRESERLSALGALAAGLGHDMSNLILPVTARLEALRMAQLPEQPGKDVDAIAAAVAYLKRLAISLRMLASDPERPSADDTTNLTDWCATTTPLLKAVAPRGCTVSCTVPPTPLIAAINPSQLVQAVFNLVQNAAEAISSAGVTDGRIQVQAGPAQDGRIEVTVSDNGPGMPQEVQQRCLEPYFTTKVKGLSGGLGLSLVRRVVEHAGGTLSLRSAPGQGTTFTLALPAAKSPSFGKGQKGDEPLVAAVTVSNPRDCAFLGWVLRGAGLTPRNVSAEEPPSSGLWVVEPRHAHAAASFAEQDGCVAVIIGEGEPTPGRVVFVGERPTAAALRHAVELARA